MRARDFFLQFCLILGTVSLALPIPHVAMAIEPATGDLLSDRVTVEIIDVQLNDQHQLAGQVLDEEGQPVPDAIVAVHDEASTLSSVNTDSDGAFELTVARGGVYQLYLGERTTVCRVWSPSAAPPHALDSVLLVTGDVARAHRYPLLPNYPMAQFLANPWVITGLVITAVVVPIALHNNRDDRDTSSGP